MNKNHLYTSESSKKIDQYLVRKKGVKSLDLMAKAAFACFSEIQKQKSANVVIICGAGNNGGDGFMVASLCHMAGLKVDVFACYKAEEISIDANYMLCNAKKISVPIILIKDAQENEFIEKLINADIVIDAILGTGLQYDVKGFLEDVINNINQYSVNILSIDVPSGICATTGKIFNCSIRANKTITFICNKVGLYVGFAPNYVGDIIFSPLIKQDIYHEKPIIERLDKKLIPLYLNSLQKGKMISKKDKGHVAVIAGDKGMSGAAIIASLATLKLGAGLVSLFTHPDHAAFICNLYPEIMCHALYDAEDLLIHINKFDVIAVGCGTSYGQSWSRKIIPSILKIDKPMIIDAGALDFLKDHPEIKNITSERVITPHDNEASRLLDVKLNIIIEDRLNCIKKLAGKFNTKVLLKGCNSLLYNKSDIFMSTYGNNILATAGSGDLLTGIIAGLTAQLKSIENAACLGLLLQGIASEEYIEKNGIYGFTATMLLDEIINLMNFNHNRF